jgi:plastocyanin
MSAKARSSTPSSRSGATTPRRPSSDRRRRVAGAGALLLLAAVLAAPGTALSRLAGDGSGAEATARSGAAVRTIKLRDSYFSPSQITAKGKTTVRFVWAGELTHNLDGRGIPERYIKARVRHKPLVRTYGRGVFRFSCTIHPGMEMKLRVR